MFLSERRARRIERETVYGSQMGRFVRRHIERQRGEQSELNAKKHKKNDTKKKLKKNMKNDVI